MRRPRLRRVTRKYVPPYPLNDIREEALMSIAQDIAIHIVTRGGSDFSGEEWEQCFARAIGAKWEPSNVGLDDVRMNECAWGAKTVKRSNPENRRPVRIISGRNSPTYSYKVQDLLARPAEDVGRMVLSIWNERVKEALGRFRELRTVVLLKGRELRRAAVFECATELYDIGEYTWAWNSRDNLEGRDRQGVHRFTWQPHGSQFTIIRPVPSIIHLIELRLPESAVDLSRNDILDLIGFNSSWVELKRVGGTLR